MSEAERIDRWRDAVVVAKAELEELRQKIPPTFGGYMLKHELDNVLRSLRGMAAVLRQAADRAAEEGDLRAMGLSEQDIEARRESAERMKAARRRAKTSRRLRG